MAIGEPDFHVKEIPTKQTLGPNQLRYYYTFTGSLAATSYTDLAVGTVPANTRIFFAYANCSCNVSCIQRFILIRSAYVFGEKYYDISGEISWPESGNFPAVAGEVIVFRFYNHDTSEREFRGGIYGTLEYI